jgi:hypothetical protein
MAATRKEAALALLRKSALIGSRVEKGKIRTVQGRSAYASRESYPAVATEGFAVSPASHAPNQD